jgi:peptidyl-prolyl cis-trans isomerase B (cyclophilin B)
LSQSAGRNPLLLAGFVVAFTLILGAGAWGLNRVVNPPPAIASAPCPGAPGGHPVANAKHSFTSKPDNALEVGKSYTATMCTSRGLIKIALRAGVAPKTVNAFIFLVDSGYYDGLTFHRVCPNPADQSCGTGNSLHIAQGGDPAGNGTGRGPGFVIPDETPQGAYTAGTVALARPANRDGSKIPNSSGGQFFIDTGDNNFTPDYNLFGDVVSGLAVAQRLKQGDTIFWIATASTTAPIPTPSASATPSASPSATTSASPSLSPAPSPSPS